ncbi:hypothetical protein EIP86_008257 [Pleurotus ostreatoroseus]|nr:hypothetical protein EIP86_008257 [Pleurotus ostreatoroseus]
MAPVRQHKGRDTRATQATEPAPESKSKTKKKRARTKKGKKTKRPTEVGSLEELQAAGEASKKDWYHAPNTTENYDGHVRRGKEWLERLVDQSRLNPNLVVADSNGDPIDIDEFAQAFSRPPNRYSALALHLLLIEKCIRQGLSVSTCDSVYSAFKDMWWMMDNERFRGDYSCDSETHAVKGNPALSALVQDTRHSLVNKGHAEGAGNRDHAEAMRIEDLEEAMKLSMSECPDSVSNTGITNVESLLSTWNHLLMRGSASVGFVVWTRVNELLALQGKHYRRGLKVQPYKSEYDVLRCELRKGWTRKEGGNHAVQGHDYQLHSVQLENSPVLDAFHRLRRWIQFYTAQIQRDLEDDDYLFPYISSNGLIHPKRPMDSSTYQKLLSEFMFRAGIKKVYSTHSFRRGGAQYRFMFCPFELRWSLIKIRWWGGWAEGESSDTLVKYLIDELHMYENDFSDALSPLRREARESFTSVHTLTAAVSTAEFREYTSLIDNKMTELTNVFDNRLSVLADLITKLQLTPQSAPASSSNATPALVTPATNLSFATPTTAPAHTGPGTEAQAVVLGTPNAIQYVAVGAGMPLVPVVSSAFMLSGNSEGAEPRAVAPVPQATIPDLPRPRKNQPSTAWKVAIEQWRHGDPAKGLNTPLRDWPADWYSGAMSRFTGAKYGQRRDIASEYERLGNDDDAFLAAYPSATEGFRALLVDIKKAREERGELKRRGPRK